jgi:hypothetical protein
MLDLLLRLNLFILEDLQLATMVIINGATCMSSLNSWLQNHIEFKVFFVWLTLSIKLCPERLMCILDIFLIFNFIQVNIITTTY